MIHKSLKFGFTIGIIIMFIGLSVIPAYGINIEKQKTNFVSNGNILYVGGDGPGNYTSIQNAINNSSDGDTIYVYDESSPYYENLDVDKSITLIGEDKDTTIIDGDKNGDVVKIFSNCVNISGFCIQNSGINLYDAGIAIFSNYNTIKNNNIVHNDEGILFENAKNNNIIDNNISSNDYGVWFSNQSDNNSIVNNSISINQWWGIRLVESDYNILSYNVISDNGNGIDLDKSDNNFLLYNIITENWFGMELSSSNNNTILENSFLNDDLYVYDSYKNIIIDNTVDGKPLIYFEEESDKVIDTLAGQIIIVNCVNITIKNQELSNMVHSIELWGTKSCIITGNTVFNNHFGIVLYYSSNNLIIENNIINNSYGILLDYPEDNNTIINNKITNNDYGISIFNINNPTFISENKFSHNGYGVQLYKTSSTLITNNTFTNDFFGVYILFTSHNNTIYSNNFFNCGDGIFIHLAQDNIIYENILIANEVDGIGIWLLDSYYCLITNNTITDCFISIQLFNSNYNTVADNFFIKGGIAVYYSFYNNITSNFVNEKPIVYLEDISDYTVEDAGQVILVHCINIIIQNQNLSNTFFGVELWETFSCHILNNTLSTNCHSLYLSLSHDNRISGNDILNYKFSGINCYSSLDNTFSDNKIQVENKILKRLILPFKSSFVFKPISKKYYPQRFQELYNQISKNVINDTYYWDINPYNNQEELNSNRSKGLYLFSCDNNIISGNVIQNNQEGIKFADSSNNIIRSNNIKNNDRGIFIDKSNQNTIFQNNFKKNKQHAYFIDCKNSWKENYWNRFRILPKLIFGEINRWDISFPWFNIDWRPAKKPYEI